MDALITLEPGETGDAPPAPHARLGAEGPEIEELLMAELRAMRLFRKNVQGWIRSLTEPAVVTYPPRASRYRCVHACTGCRR